MNAFDYGIDLEKGVLNEGNRCRIKRVMRKAKRGEDITVGFIGGSITQGCLSSSPETCYAYLVYKWWREKFPDTNVIYVNAGIGGTTSQFGAARADSDLLSYDIDFTIVEFSVNDDDNEHFLETYEGLIRKLYMDKNAPAVLIVNSVRYDNGVNAERQHVKVGKAYGIPCISMKPTLYAKVLDKTFVSRDITADDLHPNDLGHALMAEVITSYLDKVYNSLGEQAADDENDVDAGKVALVSPNAYQNSIRYQNYNCEKILTEIEGFEADDEPQNDIREIFRRGWTSGREGARICFEVDASCIGVQYRKSVNKPAPIARAVIDQDVENAKLLDANFDEDWGDSLHLDTLAEHMPYGRHTVEIEITQTHKDDKVPFYLVSLITS